MLHFFVPEYRHVVETAVNILQKGWIVFGKKWLAAQKQFTERAVSVENICAGAGLSKHKQQCDTVIRCIASNIMVQPRRNQTRISSGVAFSQNRRK